VRSFAFAAGVIGTGMAAASCGFDEQLFVPVSTGAAPALGEAGSDAASTVDGGAGSAALVVAAGQTFTCALNHGRASCWGSNVAGALGSGDYTGHASPHRVVGDRAFDAITSGASHACAIETGSSLPFCWGANARGQLGTGDTELRLAPTVVGDLGPVKQMAAGYDFTCAITRDDALFCWGEDHEGQLAIADVAVETSSRPVRIGARTTFRFVAAGQGHVCAIRSNGTIACWGRNTVGQLGLGDQQPIQVRTPTAVGTKSDWATLDLGQDSACAIDAAAGLFCWGDNAAFQLGVAGAPPSVLAPLAVGSASSWADVSVDAFGGCAREREGSLWCWGRNAEGQLGLGDIVARATPSRVSGPAWSSVSVGRFHTCATTSQRAVACTGANTVGELGVGDKDRRQTFTEVTIP